MATRPAAGETYRDTVRRLGAAQKSRKGGPVYSVYVNRRIGRLLAAAAYQLGLSPNAVTAISAAMSYSAIAVVALVEPSWPTGVAVAGLLVVGYALDSADGQVARLRGGGSVTGEWLDHIVDAVKISALHLAVLIGLYRVGDLDERWLLVPIGYAVVGSVSFFAQILNEQLVRNHSGSTTGQTSGQPSVLQSVLKLPTDYGALCLVFVLLGSTDAFLAAYTILFVGSTAYLILALPKWYRDMRDVDGGVTP
jgi:phosphatidylglycerophosphate synthase